MTILQIAILAGIAIVIGQLPKGRQLAMLAISALAVFWLQPDEPFITLKYWLPLATLGIAVLSWALTSTQEVSSLRQNWPAIVVLVATSVLADLNRYFGFAGVYTTETPRVQLALGALVVIGAATFLFIRGRRANRVWLIAALIGIILIFIFLKAPALSRNLSVLLGRASGEPSPKITTALSWLGFSYVAFRLMHTIRDRQSGRLPSVTLAEYVNYVIFFPSFTAGPIDRIERFVKELRSPLATIKAAASSLRGGEVRWDSPARPELLAAIDEEADHLNILVGNLLDMSRIESGALRPERQWNVLPEIVESVLSRMRRVLEHHRIETEIPEDLPLVPVDYPQMQQVFTNLLSNSAKYAPAGTLIRIRAEGREAAEVLVQVSNQGPQVPAEHLDRIFDKFYRITAADRITGTGLGLSICKGIVEAHGGRIWASNLPDGFGFSFTLPLTMNGAEPPPPPAEPETT